MPWMIDVTRRHRQPEIIDQPDLDAGRHAEALRGLERINFWSGSAGILWAPVRELARRTSSRPLRLLDIATGAGDVPIRLWRKGRRAGLELEIEGCDVSPGAVDYARRRAARAGAAVRFFEWNALEGGLDQTYDAVMCSLFLHHLDEDQAVQLLRRMADLSRHLVLVNDLVRGPAGFALAYVATRLLTPCAIVHTDGPRSVEGAFTLAEARGLADRAGLTAATVARRWPCRFLLTWERL